MDHRLLMPRRMGGFSPLSYGSDLALWLDPSYGVYTDRSTQLTAASSQYWSVAHNSSLRFTTAMSVSFWVYRDTAVVSQAYVSKWTYSTDGGWAIQSSDEFAMYVYLATSAGDGGSGCWINFDANLGSGAWHHVTLVFDGTASGNANRLKLYLDGVQKTLTVASGAVPASLLADTADLNIGKFGGALTRYHNGRMDSVRIWGRALSAADVLLDYNAGAGKVYADLTTAEKVSMVSAWDFDGDGLDAHGTNDLTAMNGPTYTSGIASGTAGDGDVTSLAYPKYESTQYGPLFTPPSYAARPLYEANSQNGHPALVFDGTNDYMLATDPASFDVGAGDFTLCLVLKHAGAGIGSLILAKDNGGGNDNGIFIGRSSGRYEFWQGASYINWGADGSACTLITVIRSGTGAGQVALRRNGAAVTTGTDARTYSNALNLSFGAASSGSYFEPFRLYHAAFWPSNKTSIISSIESYLMNRFGL